jgi:4-amino-4-deoxy-L-arabinose transferase-like glycosyltransferase
MAGSGAKGIQRLFTYPLDKEVSWLLPLGIFGGLALLFSARPRWPLSSNHQALVLWSGWLITAGVFFSIAGFFHEYYLSIMAPSIAALAGIGCMEIWRIREKSSWLAAALLILMAGATVAFQLYVARSFVAMPWWQPYVIGGLAVGVVVTLAAVILQNRVHFWANRLAAVGFGVVVAAILVTPGIWAGLTTLNSSSNQSLPAAYSGRASGPANGGGVQVNQALLAYLQANTQGVEYLMAVPSSMQGADYVLATNRPVLYMGGFNGQDQVLTQDSIAKLVADGRLRYVYGTNSRGGGGFGGQADVSSWVIGHCSIVTGYEASTQNFGAPDGTAVGSGATQNRDGGGGMQMGVSLYDCTSGAVQ